MCLGGLEQDGIVGWRGEVVAWRGIGCAYKVHWTR